MSEDSAVTAAELERWIIERCTHWHSSGDADLTEYGKGAIKSARETRDVVLPVLASLRKQLDEALMQASGDKIILARALDQAGADAEHDEKVIEALRAANAQMAAALRTIASAPASYSASILARIAKDNLTPAAPGEDVHIEHTLAASPSPGNKIITALEQAVSGDAARVRTFRVEPASPSPGLREGSATINAGKGHAAGLPPYALSRPVSEREDKWCACLKRTVINCDCPEHREPQP